MKIVNRATFLAMPKGTLYNKFKPNYFDHLEIKGETVIDADFRSQQIAGAVDHSGTDDFCERIDAALSEGDGLTMDFNCEYRDAMFDADQLFAVWEARDVQALIQRLKQALNDAYGPL